MDDHHLESMRSYFTDVHVLIRGRSKFEVQLIGHDMSGQKVAR
jgi:hypothetical protein